MTRDRRKIVNHLAQEASSLCPRPVAPPAPPAELTHVRKEVLSHTPEWLNGVRMTPEARAALAQLRRGGSVSRTAVVNDALILAGRVRDLLEEVDKVVPLDYAPRLRARRAVSMVLDDLGRIPSLKAAWESLPADVRAEIQERWTLLAHEHVAEVVP